MLRNRLLLVVWLIIGVAFFVAAGTRNAPTGLTPYAWYECTEDDNGNNPSAFSYISAIFYSPDTFDPNMPPIVLDDADVCLSSSKIREWYCDSAGVPRVAEVSCPSGSVCQYGECTTSTTTAPTTTSPTTTSPSVSTSPSTTDTVDLDYGDDIQLSPPSTSTDASSSGSSLTTSPTTTGTSSTGTTTSSGSGTATTSKSAATDSSSTSSGSTSSPSAVSTPPSTTSSGSTTITSGKNTCVDYDPKDDLSLRGRAQVLQSGHVVDTQEDRCVGNNLYQVYCDENAKIQTKKSDCGRLSCIEGVCVQEGSSMATAGSSGYGTTTKNIPPVAPTAKQRPSSDGLITSTSYAGGKTEKMPCSAKGPGLAVIDTDGRTLISLGTEELGVDFVGEYVYIQWPNGDKIEIRLDIDMGEAIREAVRLGIQTPVDTAHVLSHVYHDAASSTEVKSDGTGSGTSYDEGVSATMVDGEGTRVIQINSGMHEWNAENGIKPEDWEETGKASEQVSIIIYENGMISLTMREFYSGQVYRFFFDPCGNMLATDVYELEESYESVQESFEQSHASETYVSEPAILELWKKCKEINERLKSYDGLPFYKKWFANPEADRTTYNAFCGPAAKEFGWNYDWN